MYSLTNLMNFKFFHKYKIEVKLHFSAFKLYNMGFFCKLSHNGEFAIFLWSFSVFF